MIQKAGWFIGNVVFLTLESENFSNNYIRPLFGLPNQTYGVVTLDSKLIHNNNKLLCFVRK
jgi:hypothetical protein